MSDDQTDKPNRIVHCKRAKFDVYIGRKNGDLPQSKFANPFVIGVHGTREEVIAKYEEWIMTRPDLLECLPELEGKTLACWCNYPAQDCHGRILINLLNEQLREKKN